MFCRLVVLASLHQTTKYENLPSCPLKCRCFVVSSRHTLISLKRRCFLVSSFPPVTPLLKSISLKCRCFVVSSRHALVSLKCRCFVVSFCHTLISLKCRNFVVSFRHTLVSCKYRCSVVSPFPPVTSLSPLNFDFSSYLKKEKPRFPPRLRR